MCRIYTSTGECSDANCRFAHGKSELRKIPVTRGRADIKQQIPSTFSEPDYEGIATHGGGHDIVQDDIGWMIWSALLNKEIPARLCFSV